METPLVSWLFFHGGSAVQSPSHGQYGAFGVSLGNNMPGPKVTLPQNSERILNGDLDTDSLQLRALIPYNNG